MKVYSREHQSLVQFQNAVSNYRPSVADTESKDFQYGFDSFTDAVGKFILSELNFRQGERSEVLGIYDDRTKYYRGIGGEFNAQGIKALKEGQPALTEMVNSLPAGGSSPELSEAIAEMLGVFEKVIIDVEMKSGDVKELNAEIRKIAEIAQGGSSRAVGDYMLSRFNELAEVRNTPGRGAETNLPFWKLIAAGVIFGVGFVLIASCYNGWWTCSSSRRRTYEWIIAVAAIVLGAC
jgi:hypothetical protein